MSSQVKKKILIVDDDPIVRTLLAKMLRVRGIEVIEADQGFLAAKIFEKYKKEISLIISDIQMPVMDGIELLKRIRESSAVPFVLFTGLGQVMEVKQAHDLGANDFIMKPVDKLVVQKVVAIFHAADTGENRELETRVPAADEYRKIQIDDIAATTAIQSDIYLRLSETKFVKVGRKGEKTPHERLKFYRDKKIDVLYVLTTEFGSFIETAAQATRQAMKTPGVSTEAKFSLLESSTRLIAEHAFLAPEIDRAELEWMQSVLNDTLDFAAGDPEIFEQLTDLAKHSNHLYAHSLAVSLYACLVAKEHGWFGQQTMIKISLGGLFHDIGKKELDPALLAKPRKNQTPDEVRLIESHCERGRDILLGIQGLPEEAAIMALSHHESRNGTGYPRRLKGESISPLGRLIFVVDKFVGFMLPAVPGERPLSAVEALKKMHTFYEADMDPQFFKDLMAACGVPIDSKKKVG